MIYGAIRLFRCARLALLPAVVSLTLSGGECNGAPIADDNSFIVGLRFLRYHNFAIFIKTIKYSAILKNTIIQQFKIQDCRKVLMINLNRYFK